MSEVNCWVEDGVGFAIVGEIGGPNIKHIFDANVSRIVGIYMESTSMFRVIYERDGKHFARQLYVVDRIITALPEEECELGAGGRRG